VKGWPLVGRGKQLSQLLAAVVARRGAVITGSAGVGKTALAMECVRLAQERGMLPARATATHASQGLPFGALASFLPADTRGAGSGPGGTRFRKQGRDSPRNPRRFDFRS